MEIKVFSPTSHKIKALIYGESGTGKTSFAGTAEDVIFASAEAGLLSLGSKKVPYVEIKRIEDLKELQVYLAKGDHPYKTVVIDSITEINDIIKAGLEAKRGRALQIQDWGEIAKTIENILRTFRALDMHVIFIAQETVERDDQKIIRYVPSLNGKTATKIAYFMDIVGHIEIDATGEHIINTLPSPKYITKDRTGKIGNSIAPNFKLWTLAVESLETQEEEETIYQDQEEESPKAEVEKAEAVKAEAVKAEAVKAPKAFAAKPKPKKEESPKAEAEKTQKPGKVSKEILEEIYKKFEFLEPDGAMRKVRIDKVSSLLELKTLEDMTETQAAGLDKKLTQMLDQKSDEAEKEAK